MGLVERILGRLGYVKLSTHGLTLSPAGHIVPLEMTEGGDNPVWRSADGRELPLPALGEEPTRPFERAMEPEPTPDVVIKPYQLAPYEARLAHGPAQRVDINRFHTSTTNTTNTTQPTGPMLPPGQDDEEWEWQIALARARADEPRAVVKRPVSRNPASTPARRQRPAPQPLSRRASGQINLAPRSLVPAS